MPKPDSDPLRLYASILRKPVRGGASWSGRAPLVQGPLREPDEIISTAANALEYQANALEAGERLRNELGGSLEPFHSSVQRKRGPR